MLSVLLKAWARVARAIGRVQSLLVFTIIYFVFVAPFALVIRFFADPLHLNGPSSWRWLPGEERSLTSLKEAGHQS